MAAPEGHRPRPAQRSLTRSGQAEGKAPHRQECGGDRPAPLECATAREPVDAAGLKARLAQTTSMAMDRSSPSPRRRSRKPPGDQFGQPTASRRLRQRTGRRPAPAEPNLPMPRILSS